MDSDPHPLLRARDGRHARVTYEELFFDLVYVFAVTQLSHLLLHHLSIGGALQTLVLWFAVWLGWQYTCWVTNWFNPEHPQMRAMLFVTMLLGLVMSASIPAAFGDKALLFAGCYVTMQLGRTVFIVLQLGRNSALTANYRRMAGWLGISACFWLGGAIAPPDLRLPLWAIAVLTEYGAPMIGFALPGLGRSSTRDWTIEGGHLAERCQLFVIVALGETLLATGATLADVERWTMALLSPLIATFLGTLALWWLYFGTSSKDATAAITRSDDPGRVGANFHSVHAILLVGIIVCAVGNALAMGSHGDQQTLPQALVVATGPMIYLFGSALYFRVVYGRLPPSHVFGIVAAALIAPIGYYGSPVPVSWLTALLLIAVAYWESRERRRPQSVHSL